MHDRIHDYKETQVVSGSSASVRQEGVRHEDLQRMILAAGGSQSNSRLGFAVVDTGATETVGSLDAIELIYHAV